MKEIVDFLENSSSIGKYHMAENFQGFVIDEVMALSPDQLPDGWKIGSINGSKVHIKKE